MRSWSKVAPLGVLLFALSALADWMPVKLDSVHSRLAFRASTKLFDVTGVFKGYDLQIEGDPATPTNAKVKLTIDASSIDTDNANRDVHLAGPSFLDSARFPLIVFTSHRIWRAGSVLRVSGTLSLHGKERGLTIPFRVTQGRNEAGMEVTSFRGKLTINRKDYEVGTTSVAAELNLEDLVSLDLLIVVLR